jgi:hypothetical protein
MKLKPTLKIGLLGSVIGIIAYSLNMDNVMIMEIPAFFFSLISMSLGVFFLSFISSIYLPIPASRLISIIYLSAVGAIILKIIYDILLIDRSHNLFPLELIVYSLIILPSTVIGSSFGKILFKIKK